MTQRIGRLLFNPLHGTNVAIVPVDEITDQHWEIDLNGSDSSGNRVTPRFMIVDNLGNGESVTVAYDLFTFSVPPFTRLNFQIADGVQNVAVFILDGDIQLIFSDKGLGVPDTQDQNASSGNVGSYIRKDGTIAFLADESMGGFKLTNVGAPVSGTDAVNKDYVDLNAMGDVVNVAHFFIPGAASWDAAFAAAIATGKHIYMPTGYNYIIFDQITLTAPGQRILCQDPRKAVLVCDYQTFNMNAEAVVKIASSAGHIGGSYEVSPGVNCGFFFTQRTNVRANLAQYPWAIKTDANMGRIWFGDIFITGGWNGIKLAGTSGGINAEGSLIELGCINIGLEMLDARDTNNWGVLRSFPYGHDTNTFLDGNTIGFNIGSVDGFNCESLFVLGSQINFVPGDTGSGCFGAIDKLQVDTARNSLNFSSGDIAVGEFYVTCDDMKWSPMTITGGNFTIACGWFKPWIGASTGANTSKPMCLVNGGNFYVGVAGKIRNNGPDVAVFTVQSGSMFVNNAEFIDGSNQNRVTGFINQIGGRLVLDNIAFPDKGTGGGPGLVIATNDFHQIDIADMRGWNLNLPANLSNGKYSFKFTFVSNCTVGFNGNNGNFAPAYNMQTCIYRIVENLIFAQFDVQFSVPAYSGASGDFYIDLAIPWGDSSGPNGVPVCLALFENLTYSSGQLGAYLSGSKVSPNLSQAGAGRALLGPANIVSGSTKRFQGSVTFRPS